MNDLGPKKQVIKKTADSNLKPSVECSGHMNSDCGLPDLKSIRHDKFIKQQVEECIRQLSSFDKKGTDTKIKSQGGC